MRSERHLSVPSIEDKDLSEVAAHHQPDDRLRKVYEADEECKVNERRVSIPINEPEYLEEYLKARRSSLAAVNEANKRINERLISSNNESFKSGGTLSTLSYINESFDKSELDQDDDTVCSQQFAFVPDSTKDKSIRLLQVSLIMLALLTIIFLSIYLVINKIKPTIIYTSQGSLEGMLINRLDRPVYQFLGVPYAKPPIGELRFRKPQPLERWSKRIHAFAKASSCMQYTSSNSNSKVIEEDFNGQSEDCLYLNIWVPNVIKSSLARDKKPVLVWLHGGAFLIGSANNVDGSILAAFGDVIVVTVAYRLGVFGFSYSGTSDQLEKKWSQGIPGNLGLHDQVLALRWIKANIPHFGGDSTKVTLFGDSAGGISAGYHLISPISRDLFKRAIMQSGSPLTPTMLIGIDTGPVKLEMLLDITNCSYIPRKNDSERYVTFTDETFKCLRRLPVVELQRAQAKIIERWEDLGFHPVVDKDFFIEHPYDTLDYSDFLGNHKELIIGTNANEGALFLTGAMPDLFPISDPLPSNLTYDAVIEKLKKFKPLQSGFSLNLLNSSLFVFDNSDQENDPQKVAEHIDRVFTEAAFLCPDMQMVQSFTRKVDTKIFYYRFMPKASSRKNMNWAKGATHSEEIQFVLGYPLINSEDYTANEIKLSKEIMRYWTNFARFGDPTPVYDVLNDEDFWSPCTADSRYYMRLDVNGSQVVKGEPENQCDKFFEDFYSYIRLKYSYYRY